VLPSMMREELYRGILSNDIIGFHTRAYRRNFLQCCDDLLGLDVDFSRGVVRVDGREVWVRAYPLPIDAGAVQAVARRERVATFEKELLRRRRDHLILRVDRSDLSKNILRGFSAFDVFLEQHPEFHERVTFIAQLMPSRTDVPEYAEYLERIEAVVAVVNHRHGSPDWMPIQLKLRDDLEEAVAAYKHYDVLMVNAMFDGMNLVAKEGPMVNERAGVSILSENTGAHEELGEFALSVNPFDIQELADSIHAALTMDRGERERRLEGLRRVITARNPGDWIDEQLADIGRKDALAREVMGS
jgi:trehalose 6-phosphate synthase